MQFSTRIRYLQYISVDSAAFLKALYGPWFHYVYCSRNTSVTNDYYGMYFVFNYKNMNTTDRHVRSIDRNNLFYSNWQYAKRYYHTVEFRMPIQYIPRNMHTVFALLYFVVVIHWLIFPYPSGLLHWHCGNLTIAPVPAKQPWWIWINTSCEFIMNDCITTTKQSTTKPCAYFLGYTVHYFIEESVVQILEWMCEIDCIHCWIGSVTNSNKWGIGDFMHYCCIPMGRHLHNERMVFTKRISWN